MNEKARLKRKYKDLVRADRIEDADIVLVEIWRMSGIFKSRNTAKKVVVPVSKYTKDGLEKLSFKELKLVGRKFGTTDRSKKNLIKEILELQ